MLVVPRAQMALAAALLAAASWPGDPAPGGSGAERERPPAASGDALQVTGGSLARELGCGGCHLGMPPSLATDRAPVLGGGGDALPGAFVFDYLADPQRRRADIGATRMPDFHLDEAERTALALFLGTGEPSGSLAEAAARHPEADASTGEVIFRTLGCAGCHRHDEVPPIRVGPDLSREGARVQAAWLGGFLRAPVPVRGEGRANHPGARMPDFRLTDAEADALTDLLLSLGASSPWTPEPLTAFQLRRTETLVRERLACLGCHTLHGEGGRIGPSLDGIADRLRPAFVRVMVSDPQRAVPGSGMPRQHLPTRDGNRVATYLLQQEGTWTGTSRGSLADPANPARRLAAGPDASAAAVLYLRHCAACHGEAGDGNGPNAPNLPVPPTPHADGELMGQRPDDTLFDGIHAGAWVLDGSNRMPAFGELLSAQEIRSLVGYIRTLCDCQGPAWSRDGRGG